MLPASLRPFLYVSLAALLLASCETVAQERASTTAGQSAQARPLMIGTDMAQPVLYLIDLEGNRLITVDLTKDALWPGGMPLHAIITPEGARAYLSIMSSDVVPLMILALQIGEIDWNAGRAEVKITNVMHLENAGTPPSMRQPSETDPSQPISALWRPNNHQLHGPTILPNGKFVYYAQWTDNKIRVIDVQENRLADVDPIQYGTLTLNNHGVFPNPSGTAAIGTGYYYDLNFVTVYEVDGDTGNLDPRHVVWLTVDEEKKAYSAMTHFVDWLDDRMAIIGSQQTGPTSLTPAGFEVVGPSVWLVDAQDGTAQMIVGPAQTPDDPGIYRAASDIMVVRGKLYVAEEDSMDEEVNTSFISIFDLADPHNPKFLRRLRPGEGLPDGWHLSHEFYRTPDGRELYAQDWHGGYLVKIDPATDEVIAVWSKADGFQMPHGNFVAGNTR